jgi:hypothetical protein
VVGVADTFFFFFGAMIGMNCDGATLNRGTTRAEESPVPYLIDKALARGKSTGQRLRLFDTIERLGQPLDVRQWMDLGSQLPKYGPEVAARILDLLDALRSVARNPIEQGRF